MSLNERARHVLDDFQNASSEQIVQILDEIKNHFKSELTREYLTGKISTVRKSSDESERKKLCKNLVPYLDWYLQGISILKTD